jgi:glycine/D-amino acid oxidase-like deaminating enzyme
MREYDVIIAGGGTAGVVAAVQAGRAGAKCLLVEKSGAFGGTITAAGVSFPGLFHAWGKQVIAGIGWELVTRCVNECGGTLPDFTQPPTFHSDHQVRIDPTIYAAICDEAIMEAHVEPLLHSMVAKVEPDGDGWRVTVCTKTGLSETRCKVLIDCTGDANAVSLAGFPLRIPDECQPGTLVCRASGYSTDDLDIDAINRAFELQVQQGRLHYTDLSWLNDRPDARRWLYAFGESANHVPGINAGDSEGKTRMEIQARRSLLNLYRFLKSRPGLEGLRIDYVAPECGVRETATVIGKETVTLEDYTSGRLWDDAVCYSFYPIDLHTEASPGLDCRPLSEGVVPTIPRGAMLPQGSTNLITAGRCISSDRLANSALRVQATCMATGQAAGAMAALTASSGIEAGGLHIEDIHALLAEHGAIIPGRLGQAYDR